MALYEKMYKVPVSAEYRVALKLYYQGLKRQTAQAKAKGDVRVGEGKLPLPVKLYRRLNDWLLHGGKRRNVDESRFAC